MQFSNTYFLISALLFFVAAPLVVEVTGYFWHRFVEHSGIFGENIRFKHWIHHERDYPTTSLRPSKKYTSAKSYGWYILTVFLVVSTYLLLPLHYSMPMILGGLIYAKFVISAFHSSFHKKNFWMNRYNWYKELVRLHDIHHYKPVNYGINIFFLDKLFGTFSERMPQKAINTFPNVPRKAFVRKLHTETQ